MWRSSASGATRTGNRHYAETPAEKMIWPEAQKNISNERNEALRAGQCRAQSPRAISGTGLALSERENVATFRDEGLM
jgi:hypothetical protein